MMEDIPLLHPLAEGIFEDALLYNTLSTRHPIVLCPPVSSILSKMSRFVINAFVLVRGNLHTQWYLS